MVTLRDACQVIHSKYPRKDIYCIGEYPDAYEILLKNKGESFDDGIMGILPTVVIKKTDGDIEDDLLPGEWGNYTKEPDRWYTEQEIAKILRRGA